MTAGPQADLDDGTSEAKATVTPCVSIVVPLFNEAASLEPLVERCEAMARSVPGITWEYVFVNDGSTDESLLVLHKMARAKPQVKVVDLSRNFGKEAAISAGLHYASGDAVVCMDADLQHPPELIADFVEAWRNGAEVVVAIRRTTEKKTFLRRLGSFGYHFIMKRISDHASVSQSTDFRLIDRKVCDALLLIHERQRLFRGLVDWLGFKRVNIEFDAAARQYGTPTYSLQKLWNLAIYSFVSHSHFPLRFVLYLGWFICGSSLLGLTWMLTAQRLVSAHWYYTPLAQAMVFNTLLIGVVLVSLGIVGLYVSKIHAEVNGRPLYAVRVTLNCSSRAARDKLVA
ncbi:MAG: glycosyltransferase family 2 protein [Polyangiaceae bacterium]